MSPLVGHEGKFDAGFDDASGNFIGLMLVKDKKGAPRYTEINDSALASQFFTGQPGYANLQAEKEIQLGGGDWRSGFGLEVYDLDDPKRYFSSIGMDMRHKGQAVLSWGATAQALPVSTTVPSIVNGDMEAETGWDYSLTGISRSSTQKQAGTYSLKWTGASDVTVDQYLAGWTPGVQYTFKCYVWGHSVNSSLGARIGIDDGVTTTWTSYRTTASFAQLTVQKTLASSAKYLRLLLDNDWVSGTPIQYFDEASITMDSAAGASTLSGVTRASVDFDDDRWYSLGAYLIKVDNSDGVSYLAFQFGANITDLCIMQISGVDYLFVALGTSTSYEYFKTESNGYRLVTSTATNKTYQFFALVNAAAPTLWGNDGANTLRSTVNPLNSGTAWSATATTVDNAYNAITDLMSAENTLFIPKEDRTFYLTSAGAVATLVEDQATELKSTSGKNMWYWHGKLYIPCGDQSLLECDADGTDPVWRNPANYCTNLSAFVGRIFGGAGDGQWNYIAIENPFVTILSNGDFETGDPPTGWTLDGTGASVSRSSAQKKIGSYSVLISNAASNQVRLYQTISGASYNGKTVAFGAWVYASTASRVRLRISDDFTYAFSSYHSGVAGWEWLTVTKTLVVAASSFGVFIWLETGTAISIYADGAVLVEGDTVEQTPPISAAVEILAGRLETIDSATSWVWHPYQKITLTGVETMWVSTVYQKRLWIASTASTDSLYYIPLPTGYGNITGDTNRSFTTGGYFETPWLHANFKADNKAWIKLTLTMGHTYNASRYFTAEYKKLGDASWTNIGNYTGSATSMIQSRYIDTTNKPYSSMIKFRFTGVTDDTTITPILLNFDVRAVWFPIQRRIITCQAIIADSQVLNDGSVEETQSAASIRSAIDAWKNPTAVWPRKFYRPYWESSSDDIYCKVLPTTGANFYEPYRNEKNGEIEWICNLTLLEVVLS